MEILLALIAILGMGVFYCLFAYFLIRLISKKAFKRASLNISIRRKQEHQKVD